MSKSNKKQSDRLKDACRRERLRSERHLINQMLKNGLYEQVEDIEEEIPLIEENDKKRT